MKKYFVFTIIMTILVLSFILNPDRSKHKEMVVSEVKPILMEHLEKKTTSKLLLFFTGNLISSQIDKEIENQISVENYYFFSLTKAKDSSGGEKTIGLGVLNNVFLFIDKKDMIRRLEEKES